MLAAVKEMLTARSRVCARCALAALAACLIVFSLALPKSAEAASDYETPTVPLYYHTYSASYATMTFDGQMYLSLSATPPSGFTYGGIVAYVPTSDTGTYLYCFANPNYPLFAYCYTTSLNEYNKALAGEGEYYKPWTGYGTICNMFPSNNDASVAIYRYYNEVTAAHKYTTQYLGDHGDWNYEGVQCYGTSKYSIRFNANGSEGTMSDQSNLQYGTNYTLNANTFTKTGYTFTGWNTKADGTGDSYADMGTVNNLTTTQGAVVTLYAQWEINQYTVTFKDGITGETVETQSVDYGGSAEDPGVPEHTGYTGSWDKSLDNITGDTDVTAAYSANSYTIKFDANTGTGSMDDQAMTYDIAANLNANAFSKTGYTFTGWNTKADGTGTTYTDEQSVKNLTAVDGGTVTLYAQWEINQYTVTFTDGMTGETIGTPQTVPYGSSAEDPGVPEHTGYTGSWDKSLDNITGDTDVTAVYSANSYTIKFDANTGTGSMDDQAMTYDMAANLNANTFTKTGYTWTGWNTKADGTGTTYTDEQSVKNLTAVDGGTVTLYAQWEANAYVAQFHENGGTGVMDDQSFTYDVPQPINDNEFTRAGYTFQGWATSEDGAVVYTDEEVVKNLAADDGAVVDLYAVWDENADVTITYKPEDDHSTVSNDADVIPPATGKPEGTTAAPAEGYHFVGWVDAEGNLLSDDPIYMPERGEDGVWHAATVYSRVAPNEYIVTFDANEGTGIMPDEDFTYDAAESLSANAFSKTGYTFTGWNTAADGSGTAFADEEVVKNLAAEDGDKVVVYAQWTVNEYVVEFNANSGAGSMDDQAMTYDVAANLSANAFTKTGYTWTGWNTKADGTGDSYADAEEVKNLTAEDGDTVTLYSQWEANAYVVHFDSNGGSGEMSDQHFVYDEIQTLSANSFTRTGHIFKGWATSPGGAVAYADMEEVSDLVSENGGEITLYAVWQPEPSADAATSKTASAASSASSSFAKTGGDVTGIIALAGLLGLTAAALLLARRHVKGEE